MVGQWFRGISALLPHWKPVYAQEDAFVKEARDSHRLGVRQYQANRKLEDRFCLSHLVVPSGSWLAISVYDGHGGWQIAEYLENHLHNFMRKHLEELTKYSFDTFKEKVHQAHIECDQAVEEVILPAVQFKFSRVARVGSCAISALVSDSHVIVANVGDCQSCMVSQNGGVYTGKFLNTLHNANEVLERERMKELKPREDDAIWCRSVRNSTQLSCRVKGVLQPTRSFGDFYLKSTKVQWDHEHNRPFLPCAANDFPYITAEPEMYEYPRTEADKWIVVASDGLWDMVSEHEVASICERGRNAQHIADVLTEFVIKKTSIQTGMTLDAVRSIPPGQARRHLHDDLTIIVLQL